MIKILALIMLIPFLCACDDSEDSALQSRIELRLMECRMLINGHEPQSLNDTLYISGKFEDLAERELVRKECTR